MRYFLALIFAVPLLAVSLEADAGLVEDLRSGKSNVKTAQPSTAIEQFRIVRNQKSAPDYKAVVITRDIYGMIWSWQADVSAEKAVENALKHCRGKESQPCDVFAVGDNIVQGYSQKKLADAIEAYQLEVSGTKTTSKSTTTPKTIYCKQGNGSVYVGGWCGKNTEITKAEYFRLKNKKKDTASTTEPGTASSGDDPLEAKLEKLQKLLDKGLITKEEAAAKRVKLLEDL